MSWRRLVELIWCYSTYHACLDECGSLNIITSHSLCLSISMRHQTGPKFLVTIPYLHCRNLQLTFQGGVSDNHGYYEI